MAGGSYLLAAVTGVQSQSISGRICGVHRGVVLFLSIIIPPISNTHEPARYQNHCP